LPLLIEESTPTPTPVPWKYQRECEYPDQYTVGQMIWRSNACGDKVHGQFGCASSSGWPAKSGYVEYCGIAVARDGQLFLAIRYSKHGSPGWIQVYLDDESTPRASFQATGADWNQFKWTAPMSLGNVGSGTHCIRLYTDGQKYGVADLDKFCLASYSPDTLGCSCD
jgi:hypothetical protein